MRNHIKPEETAVEDFGNISVQTLMNDPSFESVSVTVIKLKGKQKFGRDKKSNIIYYALEGKGKFFIEKKEINIKKGDMVFIPKNTKYKDEGKLVLLAISSPRFDPKMHIYSD